VLKIDAAEAKVIDRWPLPAESSPCSVAIDPQTTQIVWKRATTFFLGWFGQ
jgi:hypothetical protein